MTELALDAPQVVDLITAMAEGDVDAVRAAVAAHPAVATARLIDDTTGREALHLLYGFDGRAIPNSAEIARVLIDAGADVDARFAGPHTETALHWAASCDDLAAMDVLLDAGADIEADGAVIGGGPPLWDAAAFGKWDAARKLVERGATTVFWVESALGLTDAVRGRLDADPPPSSGEITNALWAAAHGGRLDVAQLLVEHGADPSWVGHDGLTAAECAAREGHDDVVEWLRTLDADT